MKITRDLLSSIKTYDDFFDLSNRIDRYDESLFNLLFEISIENRGASANGIAGYLLVELEPKSTSTCAELLMKIALSNWDVSNREIPFYLVSQFGKYNVISEVNNLIKSAPELDETQRKRVSTVSYWACMPTSELVKHFHYWEWQEVIEGEA